MSFRVSAAAVVRGDKTVLTVDELQLAEGELITVVGPNGAGKSTLLSLLSGDSAPSVGEVMWRGRPLVDYPLDELATHRAVIGAPPNLAFGYTVQDVIAMGWLHGPQTVADKNRAIATLLAECELTALAKRTYMTLSSGERQRVEYARACLQLWSLREQEMPRWLFLDEPTANMDIAHGIGLLSALRRRAEQGDGVIAVLHDLDLAARFADRLILIQNGRIVAQGPPEEVLTSERLTSVYGTSIHVGHHPELNRLVVIG